MILPRKLRKWFGVFGKVLDEPPIEVCEAKESLNFFDLFWSWPIRYSRELTWVHFNMSVRDDHAKVLNAIFFKKALFRFGV